MLEKLKELNKKSPLQLEAWEIDSLMQIALEQAEKIERLEKERLDAYHAGYKQGKFD